jgi:hypothetical protein
MPGTIAVVILRAGLARSYYAIGAKTVETLGEEV